MCVCVCVCECMRACVCELKQEQYIAEVIMVLTKISKTIKYDHKYQFCKLQILAYLFNFVKCLCVLQAYSLQLYTL